jgi:hypothetical protein
MNEPSLVLCASRLAAHIRQEPAERRPQRFADIAAGLMQSYGDRYPDATFDDMVKHVDMILDGICEMLERPEPDTVSGTA